jgi:hypothetical protein
MWTIKIALLAAGVTLTAFANTSTYAASCADAPATAAAAAQLSGEAAAVDAQDACLSHE